MLNPTATQILALYKAWQVTMVAVSALTVALTVAQVWDTAIYLRALQDTLASEGDSPTAVFQVMPVASR